MVARRLLVGLVAVLACVALAGSVAAGVGSRHAGSAGAVRATLTSTAQPRALGVLTGTLRGQALSWRLTHHGLGTTARSAQLRIGARIYRLCAPCAASATGKLTLTAAAARSARSGGAFVDLRGTGTTMHGKLALGSVPTLQVALADGTVLKPPATVNYTVTGFQGRVAAYNGPEKIQERSAQPGGGSFLIPDDKRLSGYRDLTFALVDENGQQLTNPEATVTVYHVLVAGRR